MTSTDTQGISDEQIDHLWDTRVGDPTPRHPLTKYDVRIFARAVLALQEADALAAIKAARVQALEEAAKVCDEMREHYAAYKDTALLNGDVDLSNAASGEPRAAEFLASAIRRLLGEDAGRGARLPPPLEAYRVFLDGDQWCAVGPGFVDLQQSLAGFADTPYLALERLREEEGDQKRRSFRAAAAGKGDAIRLLEDGTK